METTNSSLGRSGLSPDVQQRARARQPAYQLIAGQLLAAMDEGRIEPGSILLESPIAAYFSVSRAPVRQALAMLEAAGRIARAEGRGLVVPGGRRTAFHPDEATLGPADLVRGPEAQEGRALYYRFERDLILHATQGRFRVNEFALGRSLNIRRQGARELLMLAERNGIIERGDRNMWRVVRLDAARFDNLYELRKLLEPHAIAACAGHVDPAILDAMLTRLDVAPANPDPETLDRLERDLHVDLIESTPNPEIFEGLRRTRSILVAGKHVQRALGRNPDAFTDEHKQILLALRDGDGQAAAGAMLSHLELSRLKAIERLAAYQPRLAAEGVDWLRPDG